MLAEDLNDRLLREFPRWKSVITNECAESFISPYGPVSLGPDFHILGEHENCLATIRAGFEHQIDS